jgi:hypothetical protein
MDYGFAMFLFVASVLGLCFACWSLVAFKNDKEMVRISCLSIVTFFMTSFLGAAMLTAVS